MLVYFLKREELLFCASNVPGIVNEIIRGYTYF